MTEPLIQTKAMDERALISAIDDADNRSYGSNLSNLTAELSAQRSLAIDLYLGKNIDPAPDGQSNVIDRSVFETVQWILPSLCRIFANGDDVVSVQPMSDQDVQQAEQETSYLNWLVTQKHAWFDIFLEWATDALLTKNAYFLVYRDNKRSVEIEKYERQTRMGVAYLLNDINVQLVEQQEYPAPDMAPEPIIGPDGNPILDEMGQPLTQPAMLYDVTIRRSKTEPDVCIRTLPPERVKVDQRAFNWRIDERCNYFEYWEETTLTELREQGYDIPNDIADEPELYTQEDYARDQFGERRLERYKPSDPSMRRVKARQIWIRVDYDGDGVAELLQVLRVGRRILHVEEVSRIPVSSGVACPLPHRHMGISIADMVADIQRIKTAILRQGLDNLYIANNPQKVLNEQFVNLDDALISRAGGVIRATDINQIRYEEAPFVFPQAMQGLEYMDQVRENRTGTNRYFTGIDQNALNKTATGIQQLSTMAAQRVEQIARVMAFAMEDLFSIVHEQALKIGHKRQVIQIKGKWAEVDPGAWKKRTNFKICVAFSAGNKDAAYTRLMALAQMQAQALQMGLPVVTPQNFYETAIELTKAADIAAPARFWTDPATIPPKAPEPPPELVKQAMSDETNKALKAAELIQREVESVREAELQKYAIDVNTGVEIVRQEHQKELALALEKVKAAHTAILERLSADLAVSAENGTSSVDAVKKAHSEIEASMQRIGDISNSLNTLFEKTHKAVTVATGKKVVRKSPTGEVDGVDVLDEKGNIVASQKALRDAQGRIVGMQ